MKDNGVFELDTAINLMGVSIPNNPNELLGKFIETREWIAKEEDNITGLGIRRSLGKIFGKDEWGYKYVSHSKNVVNVNQLFEAEILPKQSKFLDTLIKSGKEEAQKKCSDLEKQVEDQIRRLEKELKRRATEKKELLSEKGKLEASIKGNEGKKAWLEQLVKKLDDILKI
jgi:hypothetical protein